MVVVVTAGTVLVVLAIGEARSVRRVPAWFLGLLVCVFATQTALNLARPLVSYRAIALGADATAVGVVTAAYALLPIVVAVPLGRATDRLGRSAEVLLLGVVLLGVAPLLLAGADTLVTVGLASTALGFGHLAFMIAAQGLVAARSAGGDLDRAFGVFTAVTSAGQLVGPEYVSAQTRGTHRRRIANRVHLAYRRALDPQMRVHLDRLLVHLVRPVGTPHVSHQCSPLSTRTWETLTASSRRAP